MQSKYHFCLQNNILGKTTIVLKEISHSTEFLKMFLQILGMYNFILKARQDIWQNNQMRAELDAPNGTILICLDTQNKISLKGIENQKDILAVEKILGKFSVFEKERIEAEVYAETL